MQERICGLMDCRLPAMKRRANVGPYPRYCSKPHQRLAQNAKYNRYGIDRDEYLAILASQDFRCAICGSTDPLAPGRGANRGKGSFHIDHDHKTGRVRGLLCSRCNRGLGQFVDDPQRLRVAADYIERNSNE